MSYYVDGYMEHLYKTNKAKFDIDEIQNENDLQKFSVDMYKDYTECLGELPKNCSLDATVLSEVQCDGYKRIKIEYTVDENFKAPAYILVPDNTKSINAAVIALTGHGYGVADIVGLTENGEEKPEGGDPGYQKNFAIELVKKGFIVAAPELFGFGELMLAPNERHIRQGNSCFMLSTQLFMYKMTTAGIRVWQAERMFDYLTGRNDVDPERIGVMGISGGGLASSFFAAYEKRIKACVVSGYLCTFKDSVMGVYHCVDNFIPGLLKNGEMADLFGLIAPRPMLIEAGIDDDIFPIDGVKSSYARLENLYKKLNANDKIDIDIFKGEHQISGAKAYDFLAKWL
ncbi:MAG: alpha/beta hydrolase family protein [Oscillospiraceae bacterium]|nr:alpha/beta hydrolase family protein [Oscillospiraceae bacterium]